MYPTPPTSPHSASSPIFTGPAPNIAASTSSHGIEKRASETSAATAYPSPPPSVMPHQTAQFIAGRHANMPSIQGQLEIPPFNPNKRRTPSQTADEHLSSPTAAPAARRPHITTQPRPASTHIYPVTADSTSAGETASYSSRQRASVDVRGGSSANRISLASTLQAPYPGRQRVYFGPYLLLQTLGEGEFGKVKLGVHGERWGEEVAIKLIKRGSVQDSQPRMIKVAREIEVLKIVKHPNIVRLHNVIETEKYIGIVLEYAKGGELFDHILAHRYLKDRDACKLFAQLISGVSYLHAKKIIHRDLKLENLLLDGNRHIIITDFGFANRFADKADDLMATSCGSPCYAAPELVVQDGKYVGSAVDVWSCGVILYAMLAGYLPFDDDPNNPEGDNINMLYRYIINTPLSFPEWFSSEARDLLSRMLVPDPLRRATLDEVSKHPWLKRYREVFLKSVDELEAIADMQYRRKGEILEQQRQATAQQFVGAQMARSQSSNVSTRHQSAAIPVSATSDSLASPPAANTRSGRRGQVVSALVTSPSERPVDPLEPILTTTPVEIPSMSVPMAVTSSAPGRSTQTEDENLLPPAASTRAAEAKRRKAAHRYTVQVEYDSTASAFAYSSSKGKAKAVEPDLVEESPVESPAPLEATTSAPAVIQSETDMLVDQPAIELPTAEIPTRSEVADETSAAITAAPEANVRDTEESSPAALIKTDNPLPLVEQITTQASTATTAAAQSPVISDSPVTVPPSRIAKSSTTSDISSLQSSVASDQTARPVLSASRSSRHSKRISTDAGFLNRLIGSSASQSSIDRAAAGTLPPQTSVTPATPRAQRTATTATDSSNDESRRKSNRRKALSMLVEPLTNSPRRKTRQSENTSMPPPAQSSGAARVRASAAVMPPPTVPERATSVQPSAQPELQPVVELNPRQSPRKAKATHQVTEVDRWVLPSPLAASASKAKRVMDWFRWRSLGRDPVLADNVLPAPIATDFERPSRAETITRPRKETPVVVITKTAADTEVPQSVPSSRSASGAQSEASDAPSATTAATSIVPASPKLSIRPLPTFDTSSPRAGSFNESSFNERLLRFHQGAVDQNALTSRLPPLVIADIRKVLWDMGIDAREEAGPFRLKCMRRSQKKALQAQQDRTGITYVERTSSISSSPSNTQLPTSPSLTFRTLFNRRNSTASTPSSSIHGHGPPIPSPALSVSTINFEPAQLDSLMSPLMSPLTTSDSNIVGNPPPTWYGADDSGGEVRFSIEMARIKGLTNLFSVDLRRLKGSLFEYRAIYLEVLSRLELSA